MHDLKLTLQDFDFDLPQNLIAQYPSDLRDRSRMLVLHRKDASLEHRVFHEIEHFLHEGDLLVFNDAKVINARLPCRRKTGGMVEVILINRKGDLEWEAICSRRKRLRIGEVLSAEKDPDVTLTVSAMGEETVDLAASVSLDDGILRTIGEIPLPPYIDRPTTDLDERRYQTVYAHASGAVASPTAGLHFTDDLLNKLQGMGIQFAFLTLMVSWGTFKPVRSNDLSNHKMHSEDYILSIDCAEKINRQREMRKRIIAVGTTAVRVLEATYRNGMNFPGSGKTDLFIYPPYEIRSIDGMVTNFHTTRSTLLMLVSAYAGYDSVMKAYHTAVKMNYRFFSYGDSMLIVD